MRVKAVAVIINEPFVSVVIWSHLLGGVQWWEAALSWNQSHEPAWTAEERAEDGEAKQCCLQ